MIILKHDDECNKIGLGICQYFSVRRKEVGTPEETIDWATAVYDGEKEEG